MDGSRRRERRAGRRARSLIEVALRPGATVAERADAMIAVVESRLVDPWLPRVAATFDDEAAHEAGFDVLDLATEVPLGLGREGERKARLQGWRFKDDPFDSRYGIYHVEGGPGGGIFRDRCQAEAWVRDQAAEGDANAITALLLVIARREGAQRWKEFRSAMTPFNPELARWLEARGEDFADWPSCVDMEVREEGMREFGLDESHEGRWWGWTDRQQRERAAAEVARVVDGFMFRLALGRIR